MFIGGSGSDFGCSSMWGMVMFNVSSFVGVVVVVLFGVVGGSEFLVV